MIEADPFRLTTASPRKRRHVVNAKATLLSTSVEWRTPPEVIDWLKPMAPDSYDADVCSGFGSIVPAKTQFRGWDSFWHPPMSCEDIEWPEDWRKDGLEESWEPFDRVWCNPPYASCETWIAKMCREAEYMRGEIHAIIPSRVGSAWWHRYVVGRKPHEGKSADAVCLLDKRVAFLYPNGVRGEQPAHDSAIVYWGQRPGLFTDLMRGRGWCPPIGDSQ